MISETRIRHPEFYNLCKCGNIKFKKSKRCRKCHHNHKYGSLSRIVARNYDLCKCGKRKLKKNNLCAKCKSLEKKYDKCKCGRSKQENSKKCRYCFEHQIGHNSFGLRY